LNTIAGEELRRTYTVLQAPIDEGLRLSITNLIRWVDRSGPRYGNITHWLARPAQRVRLR
jgi:hypothetical protein